MTELVKYDEACRALAEAAAVDEVQDWRNKAEAMRAYARQAKDRDLEIAAAHIRFRAERRLGELIIAQRETVGLNAGSRGQLKGKDPSGSAVSEQPEDARPTLEQAGIDRKLSSRAQRMAAIDPSRFEQLIELHRTEVLDGNNKVSVDLMRTSAEQEGRDKRRQLAAALSEASVALPSGRKFPVIYADPAWHRKQGVTNRSYENHYDTMSWDEICAMPIRDMVLPDAWLFLWIPRAHMFALHAVDTECVTADGEVVTAKIKMPLAWAVAKSWGFDAYSTAFVWTKTDDEHPNDQGGGVIVFDQDEILLLFKRGRGLPKPATDEKFGSNHRERSKPLGHSRKPEFYRDMIGTMSGGVPVLELFARVDADHPLPEGWEGWGNQAGDAPVDKIQSSDGSPSNGKVGGVAGACSALSCGENRTRTEIDTSGDSVERHAPPAGADTGTSGEEIANPSKSELARRVQGDPAQQSLTSGETDSEDDGVEAPASSSSIVQIDEFDALRALSDFCYPDRVAVAAAVAPDYIARGLAFKYGDREDWSLTETGWARLRELDAARNATYESNHENADAAGVSRETNSDATYRAEYDALVALESGAHVDEPALDALRAKKLIAGKAKAKLTKEGVRVLAQHREHFYRLAKLDRLPTELRQLSGMYGNHLYRLNEAVLAADEMIAAEEAETLDLIAERANGNTHFGVSVNEAPEQLRNDNAAPIGQEPMWRQRGVWQIEVDGVPYLVTHDDDTNFAIYAVDPSKPCISSTGYRSFAGPLDCFAFGHTVGEQAESYIREHVVSATDPKTDKSKVRTKPLPLPEDVYRLPMLGEGYDPQCVVGAEARKALVEPDLFAASQPPEQRSVISAHHDVVQTRMPLDDEEIELRDVLAAYARGAEPPVMHVFTRREIERDLIGRGWLESHETGALDVTAEGRAWLASLVDAISHSNQGEAAHEAV